jgi:hypothetical protein
MERRAKLPIGGRSGHWCFFSSRNPQGWFGLASDCNWSKVRAPQSHHPAVQTNSIDSGDERSRERIGTTEPLHHSEGARADRVTAVTRQARLRAILVADRRAHRCLEVRMRVPHRKLRIGRRARGARLRAYSCRFFSDCCRGCRRGHSLPKSQFTGSLLAGKHRRTFRAAGNREDLCLRKEWLTVARWQHSSE